MLTIPRKLWQIWIPFSPDAKIPHKWDAARKSVEQYLGHWERHVLGLAEIRAIIREIDPDFLPIYDRLPYKIQLADAARPFILYKYGGLYMDFDYQILDDKFDRYFAGPQTLPIHPYLYLVPSGNVQTYYTNSFFASTPRHPFWLEVIAEMRKKPPWWAIGKHMTVMNTTGPMMLTRVARASNYTITVLPSMQITPCSVCNTSCEIGITSVKQLEGSTWIGWDTQVFLILMCYQRSIKIGVVLLAVLIIIGFIIFLIWDFYYRPRRYLRRG